MLIRTRFTHFNVFFFVFHSPGIIINRLHVFAVMVVENSIIFFCNNSEANHNSNSVPTKKTLAQSLINAQGPKARVRARLGSAGCECGSRLLGPRRTRRSRKNGEKAKWWGRPILILQFNSISINENQKFNLPISVAKPSLNIFPIIEKASVLILL